MTKCSMLFWICAAAALAQQPQPGQLPAEAEHRSARAGAPQVAAAENPAAAKINEVVSSGRVGLIGETSSQRLSPLVSIAPGSPPILAFRYFDGQARHRFGELDLVLDDAGH